MIRRINDTEERMIAFTNKRVSESEHRVMNYTDKRIHQAEEKIIGPLRKMDEKTNEHIRASERGGVFSAQESSWLQHLGPFQKLA
jgi:hypothetical protein